MRTKSRSTKWRSSTVSERRFATDIPESITTPDTLETSIGKLSLVDGFPDDATVEAVYDNLDLQRATQAFLRALPFASMRQMGVALREFGPPNRTLLIFEDLMDSRTLFLTANTESVYHTMWMDLGEGPLVVETPPNVLGFVDDAWFGYVADFGNAGPDKGEGGRYLFLPPGYDGPEPEGHHTFRSTTHGNWLVYRGFLQDGDPAPAVEATKRIFKAYPLGASPSERPEIEFVNASGVEFNTIHAMDVTFFDELNEVVQSEPTDALDPETLGLFAAIGIRKGRSFEPDSRMKRILTDAAAIGSTTARTLAYRSRDPEVPFYEGSAWGTPFVGGSHDFINPDGVRLLDARTFFFFYATGITPAMAAKMVGVGSQYAAAFVDENGDRLDGGRRYRLTLPAGIPAGRFWSIVLYDDQTRSMLQTDQRFPSAGSQEEGIESHPDGSVDLYLSPEPPEGVADANWIQTVPGKGFNVILRLYGPSEAWFDKTWKPGEIEVLD